MPAQNVEYNISRRWGRLSNPLGNVRAVVTDTKQLNAQQAFIPTLSDYYNYYAFGMLQPGNYGRGDTAAQGGYRYGLNGQEHGAELGLNHYTAQHWEYDARLARRWNLDPEPITEESEYAVFRNNPVRYDDPNGDCPNCVTAAIGGLVGGLLGGAMDAGMQMYNNHGEVKDWASVGKSAAQGAFTGAVAGFTGGASLAVQVAAGGASNAIAGAARNKIDGKPITAKSVAVDVAIGAGGVAAGALVGKGVKALQSRLGKAATVAENGGVKPPCTCFAAGTAVQMRTGSNPIEQVQVGDSVWAFNEATGQTALRPVTHLSRLQRDTTYVLRTAQGDVINTTSNHPFYVRGKWVQAQRLRVGDSLVTQRGQRLRLSGVQVKPGRVPVYNFTVDGLHTYFVSTSAILVHNACPLNYKGGKYGAMKNVAGQTEKHHLVADAISPVSKYKGPAIQMDIADHALTLSYKNSNAAKAYRAIQDKLANNGQFERAFELDAKFIQKTFGTKYDKAIQEARQYYQQTLKAKHP